MDYSVDGHRALKILEAADRLNGTVTLAQAVDLVRGLKGGNINVQSRKKQSKETAKISVVNEAGAKVSLNADVSPIAAHASYSQEAVLTVRTLGAGHGDDADQAVGGGLHRVPLLSRDVPDLRCEWCWPTCAHVARSDANSLAVLQYVSASAKASRITRFSIDEVEQGGLPFDLTMELHGSGRGKKGSKAGTGKRKAAGSGGGAALKRAKVGAKAVGEDEAEEDVPEFVFADEDGEEDPEVLYERLMAGEIGDPSSAWNSDGALELDSD